MRVTHQARGRGAGGRWAAEAGGAKLGECQPLTRPSDLRLILVTVPKEPLPIVPMRSYMSSELREPELVERAEEDPAAAAAMAAG